MMCCLTHHKGLAPNLVIILWSLWLRSDSSVSLDILCVSSDRKYPHPVDQDELSRCDVSFQRCLDNVAQHSFVILTDCVFVRFTHPDSACMKSVAL